MSTHHHPLLKATLVAGLLAPATEAAFAVEPVPPTTSSATPAAADDTSVRAAEEAGIARIAALMGDGQAEAIRSLANAPDTAITGRSAAIAFGEIYGKDSPLDLKTRELVTVAVLASLGHAEPQLRLHLRAARAAGASRAEIFAVLDQLHAYVGIPTALNAIAVAREVLDTPPPASR
ncbi:carboxymuconolactone decarboxylase family protein [Pseudoxanthomonas winnipegensis]|uniref:carboxymuconolactone decarboxylase family protein n=1 Tax=Pseudoxanthomonas winnipegensis TaxID=2480810 RepID=UPI0030F38E91